MNVGINRVGGDGSLQDTFEDIWHLGTFEDFLVPTQLAMRSLCREHFFTSEVVLRTWEPNQTVAKCVPYRWSIQYLFGLRGANEMFAYLFIFIILVLLLEL